MRSFLVLLFFFNSLVRFCYSECKDNVIQKNDLPSLPWLRERLHDSFDLDNKVDNNNNLAGQEKAHRKQCSMALGAFEESHLPPVYIFMSFSLPPSTWITLSKELTQINGVFVIRGLPQNSFQALAQKIAKLKDQGVDAPITIHPQLFTKYKVEKVPAFVIEENDCFDKITGNISLTYALNQITNQGETTLSKKLEKLLKGIHEQD